MPSANEVRGVILDIDGTLIDSNEAHARAWQEAMAEAAGIRKPIEEIRPLIGMGGDKLLPAITGIRESSDLGKKMSKLRGEIFRSRYLPFLKPFARAKELLEAFRSLGLKLAVATSASQQDMSALLDILQAKDLIEELTSRDDADSSKPDPDIVEAALRKLGCAPEQALMLGDTQYDIDAASRAGVSTVALRSGGSSDDLLLQAIAIYDDPADLLARLSTSPFAKPWLNTAKAG